MKFTPETPIDVLRKLCADVGIEPHATWVPGKYVEELLEHHVVARFTREVRESSAVDQRSGVSARFAIACVEALSGSVPERAAKALAAGCDIALNCWAKMDDMVGIANALAPMSAETAARLDRALAAGSRAAHRNTGARGGAGRAHAGRFACRRGGS